MPARLGFFSSLLERVVRDFSAPWHKNPARPRSNKGFRPPAGGRDTIRQLAGLKTPPRTEKAIMGNVKYIQKQISHLRNTMIDLQTFKIIFSAFILTSSTENNLFEEKLEIKMNIISTTLAVSLVSAMAFAGISHAESRSGNFTIQMVGSLDSGNLKSTLQSLQPGDVTAAQTQLNADATLANGLTARGISPSNVIKIDTALDGSKIVYVR